MPTTICAYCVAEISANEVEAEDGHCPECGAIIALGRGSFGDEEDEFDEQNPFIGGGEESEDEDIFDDEEEDKN